MEKLLYFLLTILFFACENSNPNNIGRDSYQRLEQRDSKGRMVKRVIKGFEEFNMSCGGGDAYYITA